MTDEAEFQASLYRDAAAARDKHFARVRELELQVEQQQKKYSDLLQSHASLCGKLEEIKENAYNEKATSDTWRVIRIQAVFERDEREQMQRRKGACTHNAANPTLGKTLCLKKLPCPDHGDGSAVVCVAQGPMKWDLCGKLLPCPDHSVKQVESAPKQGPDLPIEGPGSANE